MSDRDSKTEYKSAERIAFDHYLRTGRILSSPTPLERKFNPYHDPRNGQFTFAPGGPRSLANVAISRQKRSLVGEHKLSNNIGRAAGNASSATQSIPPPGMPEAVYRPDENRADFQLTQYKPNPRARVGGNGGPPLNDPMTIERVFPGISAARGGSMLSLADNIFDLTGPSNRLTLSLMTDHVNLIIEQIRKIDPQYKLNTLGFPSTIEGLENLTSTWRLDRASAFYLARNEIRPLQVEVLRFLQEKTDIEYAKSVKLFNDGKLVPRFSREEAIGNQVDRAVRFELRKLYQGLDIATNANGPIRIIGREYDTSGSDKSYRIPDARIANIAFDVSLTKKTLGTAQIRGFFNADFSPDAVVIVRPRQLGVNSTYIITRPRK